MNRKIFIGIFAVALTVWLACIVCILGALYYYFNKKSAEEFRNEAIFVAQGIETSGAQYLEELSASPRRHSEDVRITWIAGDGTVYTIIIRMLRSWKAMRTAKNFGKRWKAEAARACAIPARRWKKSSTTQ